MDEIHSARTTRMAFYSIVAIVVATMMPTLKVENNTAVNKTAEELKAKSELLLLHQRQ
ncbi:MAG TPA: hypothetical protein VFD60_13345 [Nitrososphaeraceae archaeon]|nr:hypothetical protein [Nitrososphaeraceae archaeon]